QVRHELDEAMVEKRRPDLDGMRHRKAVDEGQDLVWQQRFEVDEQCPIERIAAATALENATRELLGRAAVDPPAHLARVKFVLFGVVEQEEARAPCCLVTPGNQRG